jgi:hypothetical protein
MATQDLFIRIPGAICRIPGTIYGIPGAMYCIVLILYWGFFISKLLGLFLRNT